MAAALAVVRPHRDGGAQELAWKLFGRDINLYTGSSYRMYVKGPDQKRFSPVDMKRGVQVVNLIYATIVEPKTMEDLHQMVKALNHVRADNPGWAAEYREVK